MTYVLGIDLGTSYTAAATMDSGEPTMLGLGERVTDRGGRRALLPDSGFRIVGTPEGLDRLGGVDFDDAVLRRVVDQWSQDPHAAPTSDPVDLARLRRACSDAIEVLSTDVDTLIPVSTPGTGRSVRLSRGELERLVGSMIGETIGATGGACRSAGLVAAQISAFVLVGGSSWIPLVTELLTAEFGRPVRRDMHPKYDTALGAAVVGARVPLSRTDSRHAAFPSVRWSPTGPQQPAVRPTSDPGGPGQPVSDPNGPGRVPDQLGSHRRASRSNRMLIGAIAAVAAIGATIAVVALTRGNGTAAGGTEASTSSLAAAPTAPTETSPASSAGPSLLDLPRSAPLPDAVVVSPRVVDGNLIMAMVDSSTGRTMRTVNVPGGQAAAPAISPDRHSIIYVAQSGPDLAARHRGRRFRRSSTVPEPSRMCRQDAATGVESGGSQRDCPGAGTTGFNHHLIMTADGQNIRRLAPDNPYPEEQAPAWGRH